MKLMNAYERLKRENRLTYMQLSQLKNKYDIYDSAFKKKDVSSLKLEILRKKLLQDLKCIEEMPKSESQFESLNLKDDYYMRLIDHIDFLSYPRFERIMHTLYQWSFFVLVYSITLIFAFSNRIPWSFSHFIPIGCFGVISFWNIYKKSKFCNFLSILMLLGIICIYIIIRLLIPEMTVSLVRLNFIYVSWFAFVITRLFWSIYVSRVLSSIIDRFPKGVVVK